MCFKNFILSVLILSAGLTVRGQETGWYYTHETGQPDQVSFEPFIRLEYKVINPLGSERKNSLVTIDRLDFPMPDLHEMWVTVVDPSLPPYEGPDEQVLEMNGGHQLRAEVYGHAIFHQLDDLDKDGIWDELVFQTDLGPNEEKTVYIYIGENIQGWNRHSTHAGIGSYCRHLMPFWESENIGWKIWFANAIDVYAKRKPVLISQHLYMDNLDGYAVAQVNPDWGSDVQSVAGTMGGGALCLFEYPDHPDSISLPRFTPVQEASAPEGSLWNAGQISDTRYAYEVVVNGPVRSMIHIKTLNWNTGNGSYAVDQYFSVFANQSYSTCRTVFASFQPKKAGVMPGCGIRKKPGEENLFHEGGILISSGPEQIRDPEDIDDRDSWFMPFVGKALVVKQEYLPEYHYVRRAGGQHVFRVNAGPDHAFEYMLFAGWSDGAVHNNPEDFRDYVNRSAKEFNHPVRAEFVEKEIKSETWYLDNLHSINGHDLTVIGDPEVVKTADGKAIRFDGEGDRLVVDHNPIGNATAFTVEVVFKPKGSFPENTDPRFIHIQDPEDQRAKRLMIELRINDQNQCYLDAFLKTDVDDLALIDETLTHPTEEWHHVGVVYDKGVLTTYFDGIKELSGNVGFKDRVINPTGQVSIGGRMNNRNFFNGQVKMLRITPLALNPGQFMDH